MNKIKKWFQEKKRVKKLINILNEFEELKVFSSDVSSGIVKSQYLQDLKVLSLLKNKKNGYYVEFGADDGILNSNTYYLNKKFGWTGVLAEPNPLRYQQLCYNRKSDILSNSLIWSKKGVEFLFVIAGQLSTIFEFKEFDFMSDRRKKMTSKQIKLVTTDLASVLDEAKAPLYIDFLSIDTEGSEYEVIKNFDFKKYHFNVICIEHNNNADKQSKIDQLLRKFGYTREISFSNNVDWFYINKEFYK